MPRTSTALIPGARRRDAALLAGASFAGLALLVLWSHVVGALPGELRLLDHRLGAEPGLERQAWDVATLMSQLGTPAPASALLLLAAWAVDRRLGRRAAAFLVLATAGTLWADVLKAIVGPSPVPEIRAAFHDVASYPSGHVTWATTFFGALLLLAVRRRVPELAVGAVLALALMGASRIALGAHVLSDVLGGYLLGTGWTLAMALAVDRSTARRAISPAAAAEARHD